jgi:hypothetical protein
MYDHNKGKKNNYPKERKKKQPDLKAQLMSFIQKEEATGCWLWMASTKNGYGQLYAQGKSSQYAHRVSWKEHKGQIPKGLQVLHKCDVRRCINPEHLFLGTQADNIHDMVKKGRHWSQRLDR